MFFHDITLEGCSRFLNYSDSLKIKLKKALPTLVPIRECRTYRMKEKIYFTISKSIYLLMNSCFLSVKVTLHMHKSGPNTDIKIPMGSRLFLTSKILSCIHLPKKNSAFS